MPLPLGSTDSKTMNREVESEKRPRMAATICSDKLEDIHEETKQDSVIAEASEAPAKTMTTMTTTTVTMKPTAAISNNNGSTNNQATDKPKKTQQTPRSQKQLQKMWARNERLPSPSTFRNNYFYSTAGGANSSFNNAAAAGLALNNAAAAKRRQLSGNSRMRQILMQNQRALNEIACSIVNPVGATVEPTNAAKATTTQRGTSTNQTFRSTSNNSISSSPSTKLFRSSTQRTSRSVMRPLNDSILIKCPFKQDQQRARSFTIMSMPCTVSSTSVPTREPRAGSSNSMSNSRSEFTQRQPTTNRNDSPSSSFLNEFRATNIPTSRTNASSFNYQQKLNQLASLPPNPSSELIIKTAKSVNDFVALYEKSHMTALSKPPMSSRKPTFRDRKTSYSGLRPLNLVVMDDGPTAEDCIGIIKEPKTSRPKYDLREVYEYKLKLLEEKFRREERANPEDAQRLVKAHTTLLAQLSQNL